MEERCCRMGVPSVSAIWVRSLPALYYSSSHSISDGGSPYAEISLPSLSPSQPYDISIHLVIPASEANFALGNFMATLTLSTPSNKTLTYIRKPVCYRSPSENTLSHTPGHSFATYKKPNILGILAAPISQP